MGCRKGQFSIGERREIDSLDELDPTFKQLMDDPVTQILGIVGPGGRANMTPMWFDYEGDQIVVNCAAHRTKTQWIRDNPRLTSLLVNPANSYHWMSIKHTVAEEISEDDPERGRGRDRATRQDLDEVHPATRPVRAARPEHRRAAGPVPLQHRPDRHLRQALIHASVEIAVVGGSLGGLTAGCLLADDGHDVTIYERSAAPLEERGAGIGLLPMTSRYLHERGGVDVAAVSVATSHIRTLRRDGSVLHEAAHRYLFSSWNTIYREMLGCFDGDRYRLGHELVHVDPTTPRVDFANGASAAPDVVVCADGVGSTARAAFRSCGAGGVRRVRRVARRGPRSRAQRRRRARRWATRSPTTCTRTATSWCTRSPLATAPSIRAIGW